MRIALRFAYDGRKFHGYARQPNVRTVEGDILKALERIDVRHIRFRSASRTDRGVSAIGNVVAFDTNFRPEELPKALNANIKDVFFNGWAEAPLEFDPRKARMRWYRYHLFGEHDEDALREISSLFVGKHDFSGFARMEEGKNPVRTIESIEIGEDDGTVLVDIRAQSFLWQMVRRMVGAMLMVESGERSMEDIERALAGEKLVFRIAEPEPLFLMSVEYSSVNFRDVPCTGLDDIARDLAVTERFLMYSGALNKETL